VKKAKNLIVGPKTGIVGLHRSIAALHRALYLPAGRQEWAKSLARAS
jgi:hypothetical protein